MGRLVVWPACWAVIVVPSLAHVWVIVGGPFGYALACHVRLEYVWVVVGLIVVCCILAIIEDVFLGGPTSTFEL